MVRRVASGVLAVLLTAFAALALADDISRRQVGVVWQGGVPAVSFSASDVLGPEGARKLQSGLPQRIEMRVYAYGPDDRPIYVAARSCRVVYDLWEELYRIEEQTPLGRASHSVASLAEVQERCVVARGLPLGPQDRWVDVRGEVYFAAVLEFNPMSAGTVERIRRWLSRPSGGRVESDAFFGSFVSVFVNHRVGGAERVLRFRSQSVPVP